MVIENGSSWLFPVWTHRFGGVGALTVGVDDGRQGRVICNAKLRVALHTITIQLKRGKPFIMRFGCYSGRTKAGFLPRKQQNHPGASHAPTATRASQNRTNGPLVLYMTNFNRTSQYIRIRCVHDKQRTGRPPETTRSTLPESRKSSSSAACLMNVILDEPPEVELEARAL